MRLEPEPYRSRIRNEKSFLNCEKKVSCIELGKKGLSTYSARIPGLEPHCDAAPQLVPK
jgi:hypothetical protein